MVDKRLRIGMIGCGEIAAATAKGIRDAEHAEIAAVMDVNEAMARDLAETYSVPWTCDAAALLARDDVDAVYIAIPHYLLPQLTMQAAMAGKHVLCEKPMATSLAGADRAIAACAEAGVFLSIAFDAQITPSLQQLRDLIAGGIIGELIGTRIVALIDKPASYWSSGWSGRIATDWRVSKDKAGGGVTVMNAIHDINTVRYVTGLEATRVYAEHGTFATPVEVEDYLLATIRYSNNAIGHIEVGSCIKGGGQDAGPGIRLYGSEGQVVISKGIRLYTTRDVEGVQTNAWQDFLPFVPYARMPIVEAFATAVLEGRQPLVSGHDGRAALQLVLAAYEAGTTGVPVRLV
jgi:predicted dehydrogenase